MVSSSLGVANGFGFAFGFFAHIVIIIIGITDMIDQDQDQHIGALRISIYLPQIPAMAAKLKKKKDDNNRQQGKGKKNKDDKNRQRRDEGRQDLKSTKCIVVTIIQNGNLLGS